jgi:hypothetical protein
MLVHYFVINELPETYNFTFFQFPTWATLPQSALHAKQYPNSSIG